MASFDDHREEFYIYTLFHLIISFSHYIAIKGDFNMEDNILEQLEDDLQDFNTNKADLDSLSEACKNLVKWHKIQEKRRRTQKY